MNQVEGHCSRLDDDLKVSKDHKRFLNILAIQSGKKQRQVKRPGIQKKAKPQRDNTFLTDWGIEEHEKRKKEEV